MTRQTTLFLIEDNAAILDALSITLLQIGYQVEAYTSGRRFLDVYDSDQWGCLVMDLCMPDMDGLEVQQEMLKRNIRIPIIFMSGAATVNDIDSAMNAGAAGFLRKPFPISTLIENIGITLERDFPKWAAEKKKQERDQYLSELMLKMQASSLVELGAILTLYADVLHTERQSGDTRIDHGANCPLCEGQVLEPAFIQILPSDASIEQRSSKSFPEKRSELTDSLRYHAYQR